MERGKGGFPWGRPAEPVWSQLGSYALKQGSAASRTFSVRAPCPCYCSLKNVSVDEGAREISAADGGSEA